MNLVTVLGSGFEDVHKGTVLGIQSFLDKAESHLNDGNSFAAASCMKHAAFLLWGLGSLHDAKVCSDGEWSKTIRSWNEWCRRGIPPATAEDVESGEYTSKENGNVDNERGAEDEVQASLPTGRGRTEDTVQQPEGGLPENGDSDRERDAGEPGAEPGVDEA